MEVFITNLPTQGSFGNRGLRDQLLPFVKHAGISEHAFCCEKPRGRNHGFITFLQAIDGHTFLHYYGDSGPPQGPKSRLKRRNQLCILGNNVFCRQSNKKPASITLKHLEAEIEKARHTKPVPRNGPRIEVMPSFEVHSIYCGYYRFNSHNGQLEFVPEVTDYVINGKASFGKRYLTIHFQFRDREPGEVRRLYIPLGSIQEIVWAPSGQLTFTLSYVPIIFSIEGEIKTRLTALHERHASVVGSCLIYHLDVASEHFYHNMRRLDDLDTFTITRHELSVRTVPRHIHSSMAALSTVLSTATTKNQLPFPIIFQLQALAWNAYLHPDTLIELTRLLIVARRERNPISVEAMKTLFTDIAWPTPNYGNPDDFEAPTLISYLHKKEQDIQSGFHIRSGLSNPKGNLTPICRVTVTPTRLLLHGPELENKNRVLRKFPNHHDHFIRVQFSEENSETLRLLGSHTQYDPLYKRFVDVMTNGIQIAGRLYRFLGWSHSSLRAHSMWFTAPFMNDSGRLQTHFTIIADLGDFEGIRSPARCAARIGQAFSETPFAAQLDESQIFVYKAEDVKSRTGSVFSDGVGTISMEALMQVWKSLPKAKMYPTCLQIRYAGAKGMLSLDMRLGGRKIVLRPSMIKFESNENANLEICDTAKAMPLYLNRQMIKILEDMGIQGAWFLKLQDDALDRLRVIASNTYNMAYFLKHQGVATSIKLHKLLLLADKLGLDYRTDIFLRRTTEAIILRELRLLKHKARMIVPFGVTLFGVMDETGFLREGQVYVTFETKKGFKPQQFKPPPGDRMSVLVTRSPALHPGDIQRAINVIPPDDHPLRELVNCIIFSSKGERDLPSQLSGGDLDGDIFNVIWDQAVCKEPALRTYAPAEYPRVPPLEIDRKVEVADIASFFIDFVRTDHLGTIATRHMILADQKAMGTLDPDCMAMAALHSTAVDFSKTGIPADLKQLRRAHRYRPDFLAPGPIAHVHDRRDMEMEEHMADEGRNEDDEGIDGPAHEYYRSEKILGELYRAVDESRFWNEDIHEGLSAAERNSRAKQAAMGPTFLDEVRAWAVEECADMGCYDWGDRMEEAARIRSAYEDSIRSTMHEFSDNPMQPITELEVLIGSLISKTGSQSMRQRDRSRRLRDEFERVAGWISTQMRPASREGKGVFESLRLCLACAHSTPPHDRFGHDEDGIQSFPLVATATLLREIEYTRRQVQVQAEDVQGGLVHQIGLLTVC